MWGVQCLGTSVVLSPWIRSGYGPGIMGPQLIMQVWISSQTEEHGGAVKPRGQLLDHKTTAVLWRKCKWLQRNNGQSWINCETKKIRRTKAKTQRLDSLVLLYGSLAPFTAPWGVNTAGDKIKWDTQGNSSQTLKSSISQDCVDSADPARHSLSCTGIKKKKQFAHCRWNRFYGNFSRYTGFPLHGTPSSHRLHTWHPLPSLASWRN